MTDKIPADTSKLENSFNHLPELTDEDKAALESIPDDAVSHWMDGEKWDFKTKTWVRDFMYKSSVLRCHDSEDEDCVTCRFLSGDESREILLGVISNLDHMLSEKESFVTSLTQALTKSTLESFVTSLTQALTGASSDSPDKNDFEPPRLEQEPSVGSDSGTVDSSLPQTCPKCGSKKTTSTSAYWIGCRTCQHAFVKQLRDGQKE